MSIINFSVMSKIRLCGIGSPGFIHVNFCTKVWSELNLSLTEPKLSLVIHQYPISAPVSTCLIKGGVSDGLDEEDMLGSTL